ncbi:MAG: helix-turn-helix domain-containing protein [Verrucomicrobiota bacterium]
MAHTTTPQETAELVKLLTTDEAAARLGVSRRTVQDLAAERKLAFVKFGRNVRFDRGDLDKFIESHRSLPVGWKGGAK